MTKDELEAAVRAAIDAGNLPDARRLDAALTNWTEPAAQAQPPPDGNDVYSKMPLWQKALTPVADAGRLIGQGTTLGGYDKIAGMLAPLIGGSDAEGQRKLTQDARDRGGVGGSVLELGSSLIPAALTDGATALPQGGNMLMNALKVLGIGAGEGAGYGGIQASNEDKDVLTGMKHGAAFGAGGQAVAGLLTGGGNAIGSLFNKTPKRKTVDTLTAEKDAAYKNVEDMGVNYQPQTIRNMLQGMDLAAKPYPGRHDQVIAARGEVRNNLANPNTPNRVVSLPEVDLNRQIIKRDVNKLPDAAQAGMGMDMVRAMDDNLRTIGPSGVTRRSGDPQDGLDELNRARMLNERVEKLKDMDALDYNAEVKAGKSINTGIDTTLKNGVSGILTNPKARGNYTPDEVKQMEEVNFGTTRQKIERQIGRMAPGGGLSYLGSGVGGTIAGFMGHSLPLAGAGVALPLIVGTVAKKMAERGTRKSADKLFDLVASGGKAAAKAPKLGSVERDKLGRLLMMMQIKGQ